MEMVPENDGTISVVFVLPHAARLGPSGDTPPRGTDVVDKACPSQWDAAPFGGSAAGGQPAGSNLGHGDEAADVDVDVDLGTPESGGF